MRLVVSIVFSLLLIGCGRQDTPNRHFPTPDKASDTPNPTVKTEVQEHPVIGDSVLTFIAQFDTLNQQVSVKAYGTGLSKRIDIEVKKRDTLVFSYTEIRSVSVVAAAVANYDADGIPELYLVVNDEGTASQNYIFTLPLREGSELAEIDLSIPEYSGELATDTFVFEENGISRELIAIMQDQMGASPQTIEVTYALEEQSWEQVDK